jgi:hypothetical protein
MKLLDIFFPVMFALLTALFWGLYGPTLAVARQYEGNNPFKPYLMIGVAYLIWAILGGAAGMVYTKVPFSFSGGGVTWGFLGGSLGAFGALTLTMAMFSFPPGKARADIVMPIVFGGAVTVSAITGYLQTRNVPGTHAPSRMLWVGMIGMAICIVIVAVNTPHAGSKKPASKESVEPPNNSGVNNEK